jgi:hypothetical protein
MSQPELEGNWVVLSEPSKQALERRASPKLWSSELHTRHLNWSFWEGIFGGSGGLFYALRTKPPGITHQTPKRKDEVENKSIFRPPSSLLPEP